jgi:hypothetical protein
LKQGSNAAYCRVYVRAPNIKNVNYARATHALFSGGTRFIGLYLARQLVQEVRFQGSLVCYVQTKHWFEIVVEGRAHMHIIAHIFTHTCIPAHTYTHTHTHIHTRACMHTHTHTPIHL